MAEYLVPMGYSSGCGSIDLVASIKKQQNGKADRFGEDTWEISLAFTDSLVDHFVSWLSVFSVLLHRSLAAFDFKQQGDE